MTTNNQASLRSQLLGNAGSSYAQRRANMTEMDELVDESKVRGLRVAEEGFCFGLQHRS